AKDEKAVVFREPKTEVFEAGFPMDMPLFPKRRSTNLTEASPAALDKVISGQVTDMATGDPMPGVTILVQGTMTGTITDINGNYQFEVVDSANILVFSFTGYETAEIEIGNRTLINVSLSQSVQALQEIVVTALGIEREAKTLGYATASV